jgi:hypothetical protein
MIVSLGTSTALARGGGGGHGAGGHFGGEGTFIGGLPRFTRLHAGGMRGGIHSHRFYSGYNDCVVNPYNQWQNLTNPFTC